MTGNEWPLKFTVHGTPAPQGSKKGYVRGGRAVLVESSAAVRPWRQDVTTAAIEAAGGWTTPDGPVAVHVTFLIRRPASAPRRVWPDRKPDLDKLLRSTLDALTTAGVIADDARVVEISASKVYAAAGQPSGAIIRITDLTGGTE
jgi:crossover junction endodeoxyribonuclease RusA